MNEPKDPHSIPEEPYRLMAYFPILTVMGAGILLGLNWKKLGKPEWQGKTILISIFLPVMMIALAFGWIALLAPHRNFPIQFSMSVPMLAAGINLGYLWALGRLQAGAYKIFKQAGFTALQGYEYDIDGALFFGGIVALLTALAGTFIIPMIMG